MPVGSFIRSIEDYGVKSNCEKRTLLARFNAAFRVFNQDILSSKFTRSSWTWWKRRTILRLSKSSLIKPVEDSESISVNLSTWITCWFNDNSLCSCFSVLFMLVDVLMKRTGRSRNIVTLKLGSMHVHFKLAMALLCNVPEARLYKPITDGKCIAVFKDLPVISRNSFRLLIPCWIF